MERIISKSLGKYLGVFIKNYSKDALNLKFLKGEGELRDLGQKTKEEINKRREGGKKITIWFLLLEINEDVIQEVLPFAFMQVNRAYVSKLKAKVNDDALFSEAIHVKKKKKIKIKIALKNNNEKRSRPSPDYQTSRLRYW